MSLLVARRVVACARQVDFLGVFAPPAARSLATAAAASPAGPRRGATLPPPSSAAGGDAEDASEDAHDHPELAPPLFSSRRALQPIDVAENIMKGVREDRRAGARERSHVLAVLVDNEAGVLSKISGLLSARGFNIESLTVSPTNVPDLSRMTVVIRDVPSEGKAAQALKQLSDVVNVW
jgi:acetolactate synthase-1/3 small subunit